MFHRSTSVHPPPLLKIVKDGRVILSNEVEGGGGHRGVYPRSDLALPIIASSDDASCGLIQECAKQVFQGGPIDKLDEWGNALLCTSPERGLEAGQLQTLHQTNKRGVCGFTFKKGDICWNCRTCQTDPTCVQCDACYRKSNHQGHEVYFHHASPGGCCDCGDLEAWKQSGCCSAHSGPDVGQDPTENLPSHMRLPARLVLTEAIRVIVDACLHAVQCYNIADHHRFLVSPDSHQGFCVVRLHNDDVHTFNHVTDALLTLNLTEASSKSLTERVDADGHALVKRGNPDQLRQALTSLAGEELLASMVDEAQVEREERAIRLLGWLTHLVTEVDGFARIVSDVLNESFPLGLSHLAYSRGTRWFTPLIRIHQPAPDDATILLSTDDASLPLSDARLSSRLALLMATDFFLTKRLRAELHALYLHLLVDANFKPALAKALTWVYPILNGLYSRGVGTGEDNIFSFSVQLYTTSSIVRWLATTTEDEEALGAPGLLTVLTEATLQAMRLAGWRAGHFLAPTFWDHHLIRSRRFGHVLRDLDYSLQTAGTATAMLEESYPGPGPRPLSAWLTLLGSLQYADHVVRKTGNHLEFESAIWASAFTLSLPIYSTSSTLIINGLKAPADEEGEQQHATTNGGGSSGEEGAKGGGGERGDLRDVSVHQATRLHAYNNLCKAAANGIAVWLQKTGQPSGHFQLSVQRYEEAGTGLVKVRYGVSFKVHEHPVSFHLPLHRFLAASVLEGVQQGLRLPNLELEGEPSPFATLLAEFPLRCMALNAQVTAGLWRRNGMSIQGQAMHYSSAPFCKVFRDLDLTALQYATLLGGNELILGLLFDRFLLSRWAVEPHLIPSGPFEPKDFILLAEEALLVLILLITELPGLPHRGHQDAALRRELVHCLACKEGLTHSEVQQVTSLVDGDSDRGPSGFDAVLDSVATRRVSADAARFDLRPECALEYDGIFYHISRQEHETALDRVLSMRKTLNQKQGNTAGPRPAVGPPPQAAEEFNPVRLLLYWPEVLAFQHTILLAAAADPETDTVTPKRSAVLLVRCLHLLNLQLHVYRDALRMEEEACRVEPPSLRAYQEREGWPVRDFFAALVKARPGLDRVHPEQGPSMLKLLIQLAGKGQGLNVGILYEEGLQWALGELSDKYAAKFADAEAETLLRRFGSRGSEESGGGGKKGKQSRGQQAKKAQAKALAFLQNQQKRFWDDQMEEEEEGEGRGKAKEEEEDVMTSPSLEAGAAACLYCHERTGAAMGYIGFAQRSTALANAVGASEAHAGLSQRYRVSHRECLVRVGPALDSAEVTRLRKGASLVVEEHRGRRLRISSPVAGWVSEFTADQQRLIEPMTRYCWQQWGKTRLVVSLCGHAVHQDCWDSYYASVLQELISEDRLDGRYALDVNRREFLCPLCKTLSNVLVPHIPPLHRPLPPTLPPSPSPAPLTDLVNWTLGPSYDITPSSLRAALLKLSGPRLPDVLERNMRRFADSLGDVLEVPWARIALDGEEGGRAALGSGPWQLLRALHVGWSSAAYTLLLDIVNRQDKTSTSSSALSSSTSARRRSLSMGDEPMNGGREGAAAVTASSTSSSEQDREKHLSNVMAAVRGLPALAGGMEDLISRVLKPMGNLLAGVTLDDDDEGGGLSTTAYAEHPRDAAMRTLSLSLLPDPDIHSVEGTAEGIPATRIKVLHRHRRAAGEVGILEAWPFFKRPLLAHDLATLAVGSLTLINDLNDAMKFVRVLAFARLAQALLEPWVGSGMSSEEESSPEDILMMKLRSYLVVGGAKGDDRSTTAASSVSAAGFHRVIMGRWRPFLKVLVRLIDAIGANKATSAIPAKDEGEEKKEVEKKSSSHHRCKSHVQEWWSATVPELLEGLGLPANLFKLEEASIEGEGGIEAVRPLFEAWRKQYHGFYARVPLLFGSNEEIKGTSSSSFAAESALPPVPPTRGGASSGPLSPIPLRLPPAVASSSSASTMNGGGGYVGGGGFTVQRQQGGGGLVVVPAKRLPTAVGGSSDSDVTSSSAASASRPASLLDYHCTPFLSVMDGSATTPDVEGNRQSIPTNQAGQPLPLYDLSHLGISDDVNLKLVDLPEHYTELYALLKEQCWILGSATSVGGSSSITSNGGRSSGGVALEDPAICLVCGAALNAGPRQHGRTRIAGAPGVCTLHARSCGSGTGIMLLINKGATLLFRDSRAVFFPSMYVDLYGEEDPGLRRGRPLSLSRSRYERLQELYRSHGAAKEVARIRGSSDRVIREAYY